MMRQNRFFLVLLLMIVAVVGCQKGNPNTQASASGQVMYKNEALTGGTLTVFSPDKGAYSIPIRPDGTFSSKDLPVGELDVAVETESINPGNESKFGEYKARSKQGGGGGKGKAQMTSPKPAGVAGPAGKYVKIPSKYAKKETSKLKITLKEGANDNLKIELTD